MLTYPDPSMLALGPRQIAVTCPAGHPVWSGMAVCPICGSRISTKINGLAVAALVLGILWLFYVGSILAVIFGHVSLRQIRARGQRGRGVAIAGLVLGYLGVAIGVLTFIGLAVFLSSTGG
jgi:hypothetical protein